MPDLNSKHHNEILGLRDAQAGAQPTQPLDSTTLLVAEIKRVRDIGGVSTNQDTNTRLDATWDGVR